MSPRLKLTLIIIGIVLLVIALAALSYVFSPVNIIHQQATVAPSLFVQPLVTP